MSQGYLRNNAPIYSGYTAPTQQIFTSGSGTYTLPAGVLYIEVEVRGGGGGGAGGQTSGMGGGGGQGGLVIKRYVSPSATYSYAVGAGGAGGAASANGSAGTDSTFDSLTAGGGGLGTTFASNAQSGVGGSAAGGDLNFEGQGASAGGVINGGYMGGSGGGQGGARSSNNGGAGVAGSDGGGGSGGSGTTAGGAGGTGYVVVTEYYQLNTYGQLLTFTGTGNAVKQNSPTLNQPTIAGVTDGSNAAAGDVGEVINSNRNFAGKLSLSDNTIADVTSIALTSGDWDVWGNVFCDGSGNVITEAFMWVNTASVTLPDLSLTTGFSGTAITNHAGATPYTRISVSGAQTVYLSCRCRFSSGSVSASGLISARRVR